MGVVQVWIFCWCCEVCIVIILYKIGDVMYLQVQWMVDIVWYKWFGEIVFDYCFFIYIGDDLMFMQQFGDVLMELDVVIYIVNVSFYGCDQCQLFIIYVFYQLCVIVVIFC